MIERCFFVREMYILRSVVEQPIAPESSRQNVDLTGTYNGFLQTQIQYVSGRNLSIGVLVQVAKALIRSSYS
jgi:hypothetical protein